MRGDFPPSLQSPPYQHAPTEWLKSTPLLTLKTSIITAYGNAVGGKHRYSNIYSLFPRQKRILHRNRHERT